MNEMGESLLYLIDALSNYFGLIAFLSPALGGEAGVIAVSFFASSAGNSFLYILFFVFLGLMVMDSLWFFVPRTAIYRKMVKWHRIDEKYQRMEKSLESLSHHSDIFIILLSKILVGTRILIIIYVGLRNMSYYRFLFATFFSNSIWATILVWIGFLAKDNYEAALGVFNNTVVAIWVLVATVAIFYITSRALSRWFLRSNAENNPENKDL